MRNVPEQSVHVAPSTLTANMRLRHYFKYANYDETHHTYGICSSVIDRTHRLYEYVTRSSTKQSFMKSTWL